MSMRQIFRRNWGFGRIERCSTTQTGQWRWKEILDWPAYASPGRIEQICKVSRARSQCFFATNSEIRAPSEHQGNMNEEDPLVHFNREAEEGLRKIRLSWDGAKDKTCDRSDSSGEEY